MGNYELIIDKYKWERPESYFILDGVGIVYHNRNRGFEKLQEPVGNAWSFTSDSGKVKLRKLEDRSVKNILEQLK